MDKSFQHVLTGIFQARDLKIAWAKQSSTTLHLLDMTQHDKKLRDV